MTNQPWQDPNKILPNEKDWIEFVWKDVNGKEIINDGLYIDGCFDDGFCTFTSEVIKWRIDTTK